MTLLAAGGTLIVAGGTLIGLATVEELFPDWTAGRRWSWAENPDDFVTDGYTVGTDGGQPALTLTDPFTAGTILTTATDIAHCQVSILYRALHGSGLSIQNIAMHAVARWTNVSNQWYVERAYGAGNSYLAPYEVVGGSTLSGAAFDGDTSMDITDETTYNWLVAQVFHDCVRAKIWFVDDADPGWKGSPLRFRPAYGLGGTSTTGTQDNIVETGAAGAEAIYGGTIQDVIVEELVRS